MQKKALSMVLVVFLLSSAAVFARGQVDTNTYEGTYQLEDETYPSIRTNDGNVYYMIPRFHIDEDKIPQDGDSLVISAVVSRIAPNVLAVFSAEVNGEDIASDEAYDGRGGYGGMMGGYGGMMGGYGGMMGEHGGMMGEHGGMMGGRRGGMRGGNRGGMMGGNRGDKEYSN